MYSDLGNLINLCKTLTNGIQLHQKQSPFLDRSLKIDKVTESFWSCTFCIVLLVVSNLVYY